MSGHSHIRNAIQLDNNYLNISENHQTNDLSESPTSQGHFTAKRKMLPAFFTILLRSNWSSLAAVLFHICP